MTELGYALSAEEHPASELVEHAVRAEDAGFAFAMISDHYHPWIDQQGHAPFVWSVLGAIAVRTERMWFGTGVTCPLIRVHPAIVAQAAMTTSEMMPGRFVLGLGSGEALNEHVTGERWPPASVRQEMLAESIDVIRQLFSGETVDHHGEHYVVEGARVYVEPRFAPPIMVAASGPQAAEIAAGLGAGLVSTAPSEEIVAAYHEAGGSGKVVGQVTVCWAEDEAAARKTAFTWWPNAAIKGQLTKELPMPSQFEQAAEMVTEDDVADSVVCGPDAERHRHEIQQYVDAGFDGVYVHQVGPDQSGFFDFYEREILPAFSTNPKGAS
jgi:G6PDH family F420-dependent oxidoreductase